MTRILTVVAWLCIGHAVLAGVWWLLLQVPESNVWMLAVSLAMLLALVWIAGLVEMTAFLALRRDGPMRDSLRTAARRAWLVIFPLALLGAAWWAGTAAAAWHARHAGQIDAWIIARTGATRTAWVHSVLDWLRVLLECGVGTSLGAALLGAVGGSGLRGLLSPWITRGLAWRTVLVTSLTLFVGVWLPWQAVYWRPASLPPTWVQPAFAGAKLLLLYLVANAAWAVVLRTAARQR